MPRKYDWDQVLKRARETVLRCSDMTVPSLADALGMNVRTLRDIMRKSGVTVESLVAEAAQESNTGVQVLQQKAKHYERLAARYEERLTNRAWLEEEVAGLVATRKPAPVPRLSEKDTAYHEQVAVLELSDEHFGLKVEEGQLGVFGCFNSAIAETRTLYAIKTFARLTKQLPFPVRRVKVYLLGDNMEHSNMRPSQAKQTDAHVVQQTIHVADTLASGFQFLCSEFEEVEAVAVPGNHGRATERYGDNLPDETFDHLAYYIVKTTMAAQENFSIEIPRAWYALDQIFSYKFLMLHCEDVLSYVGVPWYGIERAVKDYYMMLGQVSMAEFREMDPTTELAVEQFLSMLKLPDYVCIGHFHNRIAWDVMGVEVIANGALSGASIHSTKKRRRLNRPQQMMFLVHPEKGVGWRCPIDLSHIK